MAGLPPGVEVGVGVRVAFRPAFETAGTYTREVVSITNSSLTGSEKWLGSLPARAAEVRIEINVVEIINVGSNRRRKDDARLKASLPPSCWIWIFLEQGCNVLIQHGGVLGA